MIGDHQQLRPAVNSFAIRKHKRNDVSCFERLVELDMPVPCLQTQNRMREDVLLPVLQHYPHVKTNEAIVAKLQVYHTTSQQNAAASKFQ
jgi:hypothetical protein